MDVKSLEKSGCAIKEMPKGVPRKRYFTPDGREELKIPLYRTRSDGIVYDVFLAEGYTEIPPQNPKLYCKGCDRWHDRQEEVNDCIDKKNKYAEAMQRKAEAEYAKENQDKDNKIATLEARLKKLEALLGEKI